MNINTLLRFALLLAFTFLITPLIAQIATNGVDTNAVPVPSEPVESLNTLGTTIVGIVITVVAPVLAALGKFFAPKTPTALVSVIAPLVVAGANWAMSASGNPSVAPWLGLLLAAVGTGLGQVSGLFPKKEDEFSTKTR